MRPADPDTLDPEQHLRNLAAAEGYRLGEPPAADVLAYLPVIA